VGSPDVVVIGAGAAGIIAAWRSASLGARTLLVEKTPRIGTKIRISGGGKCNITHDGPIEEVLRAFRPNEARFIRPACYRFTNRQIVEMLTSRGLRVYTRPDGCIFPVDQTAKDVVAILEAYLREAGVELCLDCPVRGIEAMDGAISGVRTVDRIGCRRVVLAVGGSSYSASGTTGDGFVWARALGHTVVKVRAALAPIMLPIPGLEQLVGVALRDVRLKARSRGKEIARWDGDLLFTHRGVSGPTVLGLSRAVAEAVEAGPVLLEVDCLPDHSFESVGAEVRSWCETNPRKQISGVLEGRLPRSAASSVLAAAGVEGTTAAAQTPQKQRNRLVETLKGWRLGEVGEVWLEKGEVVAGGVSLDEVDSQTMRSRKCNGLYLCGEVLDIAGPVGGYNLHAAFATGYVAGETAARDALG